MPTAREIREQLATLRGGALRRTELRRHLRECAGLPEFRDELSRSARARACCCRCSRAQA